MDVRRSGERKLLDQGMGVKLRNSNRGTPIIVCGNLRQRLSKPVRDHFANFQIPRVDGQIPWWVAELGFGKPTNTGKNNGPTAGSGTTNSEV